MAKIKVTQVRDGKKVIFLTKDKGKPGKTPKSKQWYEPGVETGWEKEMPMAERRRLVLRAHKGDELASARSMQALSNVTTDRETKRAARADALFFYKVHRKEVAPTISGGRSARITPKRPRLQR